MIIKAVKYFENKSETKLAEIKAFAKTLKEI